MPGKTKKIKSFFYKKKSEKKERKIKIHKPIDFHNKNIAPPYNILVDTSFIAQSVSMKIPIEKFLLNLLKSNFTLFVTECVFSELGKLKKVDMAKAIMKNLNHETLLCMHKGTYADNCLLNRVAINSCYIIATCDTQLKVRVREYPGIPILSILNKKYVIENLPLI